MSFILFCFLVLQSANSGGQSSVDLAELVKILKPIFKTQLDDVVTNVTEIVHHSSLQVRQELNASIGNATSTLLKQLEIFGELSPSFFNDALHVRLICL